MCNNTCHNHNCSEECTQVTHICNECNQEPTPCDCPVKDLSTDCSVYNSDDIVCNEVVVVENGTILSDALINIVSWACSRFQDIQNYFTIKNVGSGIGVYKGINLVGEKELKSLKSLSNLINIIPNVNGNEIGFELDSEELITFIQEEQLTYASSNIGSGANIYKNKTQVSNNSTFNFRSLVNDTQSAEGASVIHGINVDGDEIKVRSKKIYSPNLFIQETNEQIIITDPQSVSSSDAIYVNNLHTITEEEWNLNEYTEYKGEGTISRPFTDTITNFTAGVAVITPNTAIQNALDYYVGSGTRLSPEHLGKKIIIQNNGGAHTFSGNLNYSGLYLVAKSDILSTNTSSVVDMDNASYFNQTNATLTIEIDKDKFFQVQGTGMFNSGNTESGSTYSTGKIINLIGEGTYYSSQSNINRYLINSDSSDLGNNNDGSGTFLIQCKLRADLQGILRCGGVSRVDFYDRIDSGLLTNTVNTSLKAFNFTGGSIRFFDKADVHFNGDSRVNAFYFNNTTFDVFLTNLSCKYYGNATNLFNRANTGNVGLQVTNSNSSYGLVLTNIFKSPLSLWTTVYFDNNVFQTGTILDSEVSLRGDTVTYPQGEFSVTNKIGGVYREDLFRYGSRIAASSVLPNGSAFINTNSLPLGAPDPSWFRDIVI